MVEHLCTSTPIARRTLLKRAAATVPLLAAPALLRAETRSDGLVRIRVRRDPFPFDPVKQQNADLEFAQRAVFASMTRINQSGWSPYLVEQLAEDHDDTGGRPRYGIRVTLSADATWHGRDARRIKGYDFKASIERAIGHAASAWHEVEEVELIDAYTFRLLLRRPNVALWQEAFPRAQGCVTFEGTSIETGPLLEQQTSGPYALEDYVANNAITLHRRDGWHGRRPSIERARLEVIPDTEVALARFRAGELDIIDISDEVVGSRRQDRFRDFGRSFIEAHPSDRIYFIGMDTQEGDTSDPAVRQAVSKAIDRSALLEGSVGPLAAREAHGILPAQFLGGRAEADPDRSEYDPEEAKRLLAQAGLSEGFDATLWVPVAFGEAGLLMADAVVSLLGEVGIRLRPEIFDGQWFRRGFGPGRQFFLDRTFQAYDSSSTFTRFLSDNPFNTPGFSNPEFDALHERGTTTQDIEERRQVYSIMQQIIDQEAPIVPLVQTNNVWLVREGSVSATFAPDGQLGDLLDFEPQG